MSLFSFFNKIIPPTSNDDPGVDQSHLNSNDIGRPERPIEEIAQDRLERMPFVRRLASALINTKTNKSSGVVIGITGQWGAGKSSILNLLRDYIKDTHKDAIVVSFDPWLISGRNDLISQFLSELISSVRPDGRGKKNLKALTSLLADYGETLTPALNLIHSGVGGAAQGGTKLLHKAVSGDTSLPGLRKKLNKLLEELAVPIIVLIDELDRIEDHEIRAVAQLVRSVADFPGISYVLAYDPKRVIQALGEGASPDAREQRGSAYLEKIVQLQIPLPVVLGDELARMLNAELVALGQGLPTNFQTIERYQRLSKILLGGMIQTPRDISRLVGIFHAISGMVRDEVDAIDLLGYCALLIKSPRTVQSIIHDPEDFTDDAVSERAILRRMGREKVSREDRLAQILPHDGDQPGTAELLGFLFPTLAEDRRPKTEHADRLSLRRPLMTVLRLGLLPGAYSHEQVEAMLNASSSEVEAQFRTAYAEETLSQLMDRIDDLYSTIAYGNHIAFWKGVAAFVKKPDCEWMKSYSPMHDVIRDLAGILLRAIKRNEKLKEQAATIFTNLRNGDDNVLTATWLRHHIFAHGLFRQSTRDSRDTFLTDSQTKALAIEMSQQLRPLQIMGKLIPCRWDLQPVYTMLDTELWDSDCRRVLQANLAEDVALDGFTLMLYGAEYSTGREAIDKLCSYEFYSKRVKERIASTTLEQAHETVRIALRKADDPFR